jgi:dihydrofolate reductase
VRKLIVSEFVSLDGVIENPMWTFPYWNEEVADFKYKELFSTDNLLLGRVTYDGFAQAWPERKGSDDYAYRINTMSKYVVSSTLTELLWENSIQIKDNVIEQIKRLKEEPGQDILIFGSGALYNSLIPYGLIDRYHLIVYPLTIGTGQKLFNEGIKAKLKLIETQPFSSGAAAMVYETER